MRTATLLLGLLALGMGALGMGALGMGARAALAHESKFPVAGDLVEIRENGFDFQTSGQQHLGLRHDPSVDGMTLLVRGVGESPATPG